MNKIINFEDFFEHIASKLRKCIGLKYFIFLVPDGQHGNFVTKFSTNNDDKISFTIKEINILGGGSAERFFYLKTIFHRGNLLKRILQIKIICKFKLFGISAVMPIHCDDRIICLIIFKDRRIIDRIKENNHLMDKIRGEIAYCLGTILLYNQTLERIIRDYDL